MSLDVGDGGFPVGLAADTAGHLYASSYQAGLIYKIDPVYVLLSAATNLNLFLRKNHKL